MAVLPMDLSGMKRSDDPSITSRGVALTMNDLATLAKSYITPDLAKQAGIFRVNSHEGAALVGRNGRGDYSGIVFPYQWPGESKPREYRLRRDHPDLEKQPDDLPPKEKAKYLSPPGRGNKLYFPPQIDPADLENAELPIVIVEGEKKCLALHRLSVESGERFLPIGIAGVWSFRSVVGKENDAKGSRRDVKGIIPDFDRIVWKGRTVKIVFDTNVATNKSVKAARAVLSKELLHRGAVAYFVDLPTDLGVNGVDDLLAAKGPDYVLGLIEAAQTSEEKVERKSEATRLVELASNVELFHTPDDEAYASFQFSGHLETWPVNSSGFRSWLTRKLYETEHKAPTAQSLKDALNALSSVARFDGKSREVHLRIAEHDGAIYVDLCDHRWRVAKVTAESWQIISAETSQVRFRRSKGMLALPEPIQGSSIAALRDFVNIPDSQWPLFVAALVAYFRPNCPFPVLALHGEQGSAKSTTARVLRALIDPNQAALRSEPKDERDLMIAAKNGWVIAFDNLSRIPPLLSDAICRLATGGGFGTRKLYENDEEVLFDAMRPVIVNGIEELATRSDLLDRALVLTLPAIPDHKRQTQGELWEKFKQLQPTIFGALLDAVSCALRNVSNVRLDHSPRMADFAQWATAAEPALGLQEGEFMRAYSGNREIANDLALEASTVAPAVLAFIDECEHWKGTSSELLSELNSLSGNEGVKKQQGWPKSYQAMGGILKRIAPNLRAVGVKVERGTGRERRTWILEKLGASSSPLSRLSPSTSVTSSERDIDQAGAPYLSRNLSQESAKLNPSHDNGDKGDNHLPELSEARQLDDETLERAAIVEFDGGRTRDEAEQFARKKDVAGCGMLNSVPESGADY
jgi:hypothetical protein